MDDFTQEERDRIYLKVAIMLLLEIVQNALCAPLKLLAAMLPNAFWEWALEVCQDECDRRFIVGARWNEGMGDDSTD